MTARPRLGDTMTKRAILYARVSGDDRKYATSGIDSQLADGRKYAAERGYEVVGEFYETPDKVTSGADWLPELDRVMKLAQTGGFEVMVVREIDRLARNRFKQMSVEIQLESCGARVEYVIGQFEESAEGRLLKGLMSEFAEYEREKIRQRTARGIVRSVEAGNVKLSGFGAPYGYTLATEGGKRVLIVNEQEAAIVRLVFEMYVSQRLGMYTIAYYLSEHRIPAPKRSGAWQDSVVGFILANETYTGRWYYGKIKRRKTPERKAVKVTQPRDTWIEVSVPAIISKEVFDAASHIRDENKRLKGKQKKNFYLLGGMLRCGECGHSVTGRTIGGEKKYRYYKCAVAHSPKRFSRFCLQCSSRHYCADDIDRVVWEYVKAVYMQPDVLKEALNNYRTMQSEVKSPLLQMIETTQAALETTTQEKARLLKAYTSGVLSLDDIATEKMSLDKRVADLARALDELRQELKATPVAIGPEVLDAIEQDAADLREGLLRADNDPQAQRRIFEQLNLEGRLFSENGKQWIEVNSVLGGNILSTENSIAK